LREIKRIDVHHHIVPKEYVQELNNKGIQTSLGHTFPDWNADKSLEIMDRFGISLAVISISAPGVYFNPQDTPDSFSSKLSRQTNEICAELINTYPERFAAFATLPLPYLESALREMEYALDVLKLDGVVLLSNYDGRYLGDPYYEEIMQELNRRKAIVFVHPQVTPGLESGFSGYPPYMMDVCWDTTRTAYSMILSGVMEKYPEIRFILAHAGGAVPYLAGRLSTMTKLGLPYVDNEKVIPKGIEHYLKRFCYDTAISASPYTLASLHALAGSSNILLGTDYVFAPVGCVPLTIQGVRDYDGFSEKDLVCIEYENALSLFPRINQV